MTKTLNITEQRAHPRISAPATAYVRVGDQREELPVRDVSRGGMFVHGPVGLLKLQQAVEVDLSLLDRSFQVTVLARVVREQLAPKEESGYGLRFEQVGPELEARLRDFLRRLVEGPGGHRRAFPRISHRLRVQCTGSKEVKAILRDLSLGGAGLWLDTPLAMEESVLVQLFPEDAPAFDLHGRVVSTRWAMDEHVFDQAGVEFVDLTLAQTESLKAYLLKLLGG